MANINLLPWREEAKLKKQHEFNMYVAFAFLVGLLFAVVISLMLDGELGITPVIRKRLVLGTCSPV